MKVSGFGSVKSSSGVKKRGATPSVGSFADLLGVFGASESSAPAPASDVSATSAIGNLLALQEISEDDLQRQKLVQQGKNMLDTLEELRHQLLRGKITQHTLLDIKRQVELKKQQVTDPALREIIDDIELRASVELAKLETAMVNQRAGRTDRLD